MASDIPIREQSRPRGWVLSAVRKASNDSLEPRPPLLTGSGMGPGVNRGSAEGRI